MILPSIGSIGAALISWLTSVHPLLWFFAILGGIALGLFASNELAAKRMKRRFPDLQPESAYGQQFTQAQIAERLSFIQKLTATTEQLVKNIHYNIHGSISHSFTKFCEEPAIRDLRQSNPMAHLTIRQMIERFHRLTFDALESQDRCKKLKAEAVTDEDITLECNEIAKIVREYRNMVDE